MTKLEDLIKNNDHDMEDEYRETKENRSLALLIFILGISAFIGTGILINWLIQLLR